MSRWSSRPTTRRVAAASTWWSSGASPAGLARSRTPDRVRLLGCPGCGAPQEALLGTCRHCGRTVNDGSFDWLVHGSAWSSASSPAHARVPRRREGDEPADRGGSPSERGHRGAARRIPRSTSPSSSSAWPRLRPVPVAWSNRNLAQMRPFLSDALFPRRSTTWRVPRPAPAQRPSARGSTNMPWRRWTPIRTSTPSRSASGRRASTTP